MLTNGKKLDGRYVVREEIGSGGFGAVYLAEDSRFSGNNLVAIKKIVSTNQQITDSFRQEADLLYNLSHPNLPKVTNCFQEEGASFIVMDYISGEDLAEKLKKGKNFSVKEVLEIADKVLDALEYLHSVSIFHRDIKPHNIKIDENGKIFLLDFGTAKGSFDDAVITQKIEQSVVGYTPFYAPLEQILRVDTNSYLLLQSTDSPHLEAFLDMKTDARSDIYSLGATLYHLLSGYSPEKATATIRAHLIWSGKQEPLPELQILNPQIPDSLASIIKRCMEILPDKRFQTAEELREALKNQGEIPKTIGTEDKTIEISAEYIPIQKPKSVRIPTGDTALFDSETSLENIFARNDSDKSSLTETALYIDTSPVRTSQTENVEDTSVSDVDNENKSGVRSIESLFPPEEKSEKHSGAKIFAAVGGLFFLLILLGLAGFFAVRQFNLLPAGNENSDTGKNENNSGTKGGTANNSGAKRTIDYSLIVQKMRDGEKYQEPFESSGQEIFESGYQFQMLFTPPEDGFLYVFAEGLNDKGEKNFNIIFPTPVRNEGKANVSGKQKYETGWNVFGGKPGTENFWMIWVRNKNEMLENSREKAFAGRMGELTDAELKTKLKNFLENEKSKSVNVEKNTASKLTHINFEGDSTVYLIELEHR